MRSGRSRESVAGARWVVCLAWLLLWVAQTAIGRAQPAESGPGEGPDRGPGEGRSCVPYESKDGIQLLGEVLRPDILSHFPAWQQQYEDYRPDFAALVTLARLTRPVEILCVLGTWCHDSQRELPRYWKILDMLGSPHLTLKMLAVGRASDPQAAEQLAALGFAEDIRASFSIERVPTFIFLYEGEELGRIIESPSLSLEQDTGAILANLVPGPDPSPWR